MFARIAIILALVCIPLAARAQGIVRDDFEGPEPAMRPAGGDGRHRVDLHQRVEEGPHSGRRAEKLQITGGGAMAIYYSYPVRPARVIGELAFGLWLRADRPGLQLVARVVLPRSPHPKTGEPLTTLIRGSDYRQVGNWQLVRVENLQRALDWQVRVLRAQFGPQVDGREAYVDMVLVNVYGGSGTTTVWMDDLEIVGAISPVSDKTNDSALILASGTMPLPEVRTANLPAVEFKSRLLVGDEPFFPRMIEYRGEPLPFLQKLGFNCVRLGRSATPEELALAAQLQLWLIASPPPLSELKRPDPGPGAPPPAPAIGAEYDAVLAWDMGSRLTSRELEVARSWADAVQRADSRGRPIMCGAVSDLQNYTRPPFKVLLAERDVLGTTLPIKEYDGWLAERSQLARAGSPLWASIPSQASPQLVEQMRLVSGVAIAPPPWQETQMRALVHLALASRARGICFSSHSRLDAADAATRVRAITLELLNLELQLIERWPAAGNFSTPADTSEVNTTGAIIETERSQLLLPIYQPPNGQFVSGTQAAGVLGFTVAGAHEGDNAYELSLTALRPIRLTRKPGGMLVVLGERSRDSLVVFTADPTIIRSLRNGIAKIERRALYLSRELATAQLAQLDDVLARTTVTGANPKLMTDARKTIEDDLRRSDGLAASKITGNLARAYDEARHALQVINQTERVVWELSTAKAAPLSDPLMASFATLPAREVFLRQMAAAPRSPNRLIDGSCEDLSAMLASGWKHFQHPEANITTAVEFTPHAAHSGGAGLLLRAMPTDEKVRPGAIETPPVWITTAPIAVEAGDLVEIQAWIRIDVPLSGSVDGLVMLDTHSGESLAVRSTQTKDWQQVTAYRSATQRGPFALTFALAGLGEVAIDDISMQIVERGQPGSTPPASGPFQPVQQSPTAAGMPQFQPPTPAPTPAPFPTASGPVYPVRAASAQGYPSGAGAIAPPAIQALPPRGPQQ